MKQFSIGVSFQKKKHLLNSKVKKNYQNVRYYLYLYVPYRPWTLWQMAMVPPWHLIAVLEE